MKKKAQILDSFRVFGLYARCQEDVQTVVQSTASRSRLAELESGSPLSSSVAWIQILPEADPEASIQE